MDIARHNLFLYLLRVLLLLSVVLLNHTVLAAPGDTLFSDDFESGFGNWTTAGAGNASVGTETSNSGTSSMRLRWDTITATSIAVNTNVPAAELSIWVRRGDDAFSEDPDVGGTEDLVLEYLDNTLTWIGIETFLAGTPTGQIFTRTYTLPASALHANFQIRFTMPDGSGGPPNNGGIGFDYWHIDDTIVTETIVSPSFGLGSCDDFESGFINWTTSGVGSAGVGGQTSNSPSASMFLRWDTVTATSTAIDLASATSVLVSAWIQRGSDTFSENPETGEDLVLEYFTNTGVWVALETFTGGGTQGEIFNRNYTLPTNALHAGFQLRFRFLTGSGGPPENNGIGWDFWHVDDVCVLNNLNAYYAMDEAAWNSAGDIADSSGNGNDGNPIGNVTTASSNPAIAGSPGTCGYGVFPLNNNTATIDAVDTTVTPGMMGAISFWYNSNNVWSGGGSANQMLLDASADLGNNSADKYFFLVKRSNGRLRFRLEDSGDTDTQAETAAFNFAANTWVHIAITWDLLNDRTEIYVNGTLSATSTTNVNGVAGAWNSLYIGDNRTSGVSGSGYTGGSANGLIDEVRFYGSPISATQVAADIADTHPCTLADHFSINHDTTAINCQAEPITIAAHAADHSVVTSYTGTLNLSTSTGNGDWTIISANGTLNNGTADDGIASYDMVAADNGQVVLGLKVTQVETVNIDVSDSVITESSGNALPTEDQDLIYAQAGFVFLGNNVVSAIGTQIGGKSSNIAPGAQVLELQAVRTSDTTGACEAALQNVNAIELAFECRNPTSCTSRQVNIDGGTATNIVGNPLGGVTSYTSVNLDFGDASDTTATFVLNYPDVGEIQLYARYNIPLDDGVPTPSGNFMLGNSNAFVVRPFGFHVDVTGNPAANLATGPLFTQAGTNFTINSTAVLWDAADDTDNNGVADNHDDTNPANNADLSNNTAALNYGQEVSTESLGLSAQLNQPGGGNDPGLTGTTTINSFTNGAGSTGAARYEEVGIIEIAANIDDANYLGLSAAATANIIGRSGYVGRFNPNHFRLSAGVINNRIDAACALPASFTYMGEILQLEFTLTAENFLNATTQNYVAGFIKLDPTVIANFNIGATDTVAPTPLTARIANDTSTGAWVNGVANIFARTQLNRDTIVDGPFQNLAWGIDPVDSDMVRLNSYNLDIDNDTTNDRGQVALNDVRFGRAIVESVAGSERLALTLPVYTEYFNGTQFIRNTDDNCLTYDATDISFSNRVSLPMDPVAVGNGVLIQGNFDPINPITLNSNNEVGNVDATWNVPSWLEFDWNNNGLFNDDPFGKATFGVFSGSERQIYIREVY